MELGMVGLGRMGGNMAIRLVRAGHRVVGYARRPEQVQEAVAEGVTGSGSLAELVQSLHAPRVVWLMIPAGAPTDEMIADLLALLSPGDLLVDGGNSYYKDTLGHAKLAAGQGVHFVDVGTSGGIWGLKEGYSMMVGGDPADVALLTPALQALAPSADSGWGRVGPVGSGHFVKMVHNGIEYGLMEAYAEGFAILAAKTDFGLDLAQVADIWKRGSVVRSWLLDLTADALHHPDQLAHIAPFVSDSGEGRWTVFESIDLNISAPVIALALQRRIRSREPDPLVEKLLAAMRQEFGGHAIKSEP
ncbi:MAG: decarboxylating 6-phosphogluconate dehydrogenase [Thermoplasmata archaeon]|nr:decarboxylating 6-phosphogluconate dehydrogenase [Thermoplasmata archaeon]